MPLCSVDAQANYSYKQERIVKLTCISNMGPHAEVKLSSQGSVTKVHRAQFIVHHAQLLNFKVLTVHDHSKIYSIKMKTYLISCVLCKFSCIVIHSYFIAISLLQTDSHCS